MNSNEKKRRRRTGCLTCRTRRVKCDEGRPTCERCNAANVECIGYEKKRSVETLRLRRPNTSPDHQGLFPESHASLKTSQLTPCLRAEGIPLVAFPSNPLPLQRTHPRARDLLAYHQFLFRTLPVLFRSEQLHFWRDTICQEAWEHEFLFDTILAVGGAHRAVLFMSSGDETDKVAGVDHKLAAVQAYTRALQALSEYLEKPERSLELSVGALLLMSWFECLPGNIPAALRHTYTACRYFLHMQVDGVQHGHPHLGIFEASFRDLRRVFRIMLPVSGLCLPSPRLHNSTPSSNSRISSPESANSLKECPESLLQQLLDFISDESDLENIVWDSLAPCSVSINLEKILALQSQLKEWRVINSRSLPQSDFESTISNLSRNGMIAIEDLPIPPRTQPPISPRTALIAALYNFYMARTMWALGLLDNNADQSEISAYLHIYEVMQLVGAATENLKQPRIGSEAYVPRECLRVGFLPILYFAGLSTPKPNWLRWVTEKMNEIGQEGLFRGADLAKSLNGLYTFELCNSIDSPLMLDQFPSPRARVLVVLIPAEDGHHFTAYYAAPLARKSKTTKGGFQYYPLGHATWSSIASDDASKPDLEVYKSAQMSKVLFNREWLQGQETVQEWITWSSLMDFNVDLLLRDHVAGCHLWPGGDFGGLFSLS